MAQDSLKNRRERALGAGAELFYGNPIEIVRGEGAYLFDRDDRRFVDMYNNVPCVGHGNTAVVEAMAQQQATLNVHSRYLHEGIVDFSERLTALNHEGIESAIFCCSGTEAVEVALMMARMITGHQGLVCTNATYHGNSDLVDSMSDLHARTCCPESIRAFPFPDSYRPLREGLTEAELCQAYLTKAAEAIDDLNSSGQGFAGLIVCPIFANEGLPDIPHGFMQKLTDLVHERGGLMISDEVQSGHGRTGHWWGYECSDFRPDIVTLGKPTGNGLPISAALTRKDWIDHFRARKDYFNTTAATPLQAAVGMAVLDEIERMDLVQNAADLGAYLLEKLAPFAQRHPFIGDVRGRGLFISLDLVNDPETKVPNPALAKTLSDHLLERGFLVSYAGKYANCLKIRPPLVFSREHADQFLDAFQRCVATLDA